jgi:hypothetical protein
VSQSINFKNILSYAFPALLFLALNSNAQGQANVAVAVGSVSALSKLSDVNDSHTENATKASEPSLLESVRAAKASSEKLLASQEEELKQATAKLEQLTQLAAEGLIARNEVTQQQQAITFLEGTVNGTRQQIVESDRMIAGLLSQEEIKKQNASAPAVTKYRSLTSPTILRYGGSTNWSVANLSQVQAFFSSQFGRGLPISTIGQSATHNRLGWDHRHAVDVALHPDSTEGKALIAYLQSQGISYLAFRGAVPGVSTGPHIHIGTPSHRLG